MAEITYLLTGGVRSGKSSYALKLASKAEHPFYIATGWDGDEEMKKRIRKHQTDRNDLWKTIEEQTKLACAIEKAVTRKADFIIVDCLGAWITNLMLNEKICDIKNNKEVSTFVDAVKNTSIPLAIVTNEVGMGLVPENQMARDFRDNLGFVNQLLAKITDRVILMVSGIPMQMK